MPRPTITWTEAGQTRTALWHCESGSRPPRRVEVASDDMKADLAYRLACEGTAVLWRGDFHNAKQLLSAVARRVDRPGRKAARPAASASEGFHRHRQARGRRAAILGMLLIPVDPGHVIALRRAPDVRQACAQVRGEADTPYLTSLRDLLALIGAHEWRRTGVEIAALGDDRIHPHYGVFSPVRGEYVDLVARAPMPETGTAFDIGTGTGVLAAVLARRGVSRIVATDQDPRALACATENLAALGLGRQVSVCQADLFPPGRADLIVCNPPWVPAKLGSGLDAAVYDPGSRMLLGFLNGLADHLEPRGEAWLVLSDLAEHLGLRTRQQLLDAIEAAGLVVLERLDIKPRHPRAGDRCDPLHHARSKEVTSLWRLALG